VIDLHCHVLPGVDDGPRELSAALALARAAAEAGATVLVATPHIDLRWRLEPLQLPARVAALQRELDERGIALQLRVGGEIALPRLPDLDEQELDTVRLGGGPYLLLECPLEPASWDFDVALMRLRERGESILLAHPERCPLFQREPQRLAQLVRAGLLCSITAGSMWGQFGSLARAFCARLLHDGLVHDVASDAHDARRRPPGLGEAFASMERELPGISAQRRWLTQLAPEAILNGTPLPPR